MKGHPIMKASTEVLRALAIVAVIVGALLAASKCQLDMYDKNPSPTPTISSTR